MAYIEFNDITKEYKMGETTIKALDCASFTAFTGYLPQRSYHCSSDHTQFSPRADGGPSDPVQKRKSDRDYLQ